VTHGRRKADAHTVRKDVVTQGPQRRGKSGGKRESAVIRFGAGGRGGREKRDSTTNNGVEDRKKRVQDRYQSQQRPGNIRKADVRKGEKGVLKRTKGMTGTTKNEVGAVERNRKLQRSSS